MRQDAMDAVRLKRKGFAYVAGRLTRKVEIKNIVMIFSGPSGAAHGRSLLA